MLLLGLFMVGAYDFILCCSGRYRTKYILTDEELIIKATVLIGGSKTIPLGTVRSVEKILMPFGIKLFGSCGIRNLSSFRIVSLLED